MSSFFNIRVHYPMSIIFRLFDFRRHVDIAFLYPPEDGRNAESDIELQPQPNKRAHLPIELPADEGLGRGQPPEVGKASIEGHEHAGECMRREAIDKPGGDEEEPGGGDVLHQRSHQDDPWFQRKYDQKVEEEGDEDAGAEDDGSRLPSQPHSPLRVEEGADDHWHDDDVGDVIGSVTGEAGLDHLVVVEGSEEVEALHVDQEVAAQSKVAGGWPREHSVVSHDFAEGELTAPSLAFQHSLIVLQMHHLSRHQHHYGQDAQIDRRRSDGRGEANGLSELHGGELQHQQAAEDAACELCEDDDDSDLGGGMKFLYHGCMGGNVQECHARLRTDAQHCEEVVVPPLGKEGCRKDDHAAEEQTDHDPGLALAIQHARVLFEKWCDEKLEGEGQVRGVEDSHRAYIRQLLVDVGHRGSHVAHHALDYVHVGEQQEVAPVNSTHSLSLTCSLVLLRWWQLLIHRYKIFGISRRSDGAYSRVGCVVDRELIVVFVCLWLVEVAADGVHDEEEEGDAKQDHHHQRDGLRIVYAQSMPYPSFSRLIDYKPPPIHSIHCEDALIIFWMRVAS